jgi:hypothetical protein
VKGIVYFSVNQIDLQKLNAYEWEYTPIQVQVQTSKYGNATALAYLYNDR